jgi:hypothetical protein
MRAGAQVCSARQPGKRSCFFASGTVKSTTVMRASPSGKASAFQADIHGFESRRPLSEQPTLVASIFGLVAQRQSARLITAWSQVRILPGPQKIPVLAGIFAFPILLWEHELCGFQRLVHIVNWTLDIQIDILVV